MRLVWARLSGTVVILTMPAFAGDVLCGTSNCNVSMRDKLLAAENKVPGDSARIPFSISVDGETVGRSEAASVKGPRQLDTEQWAVDSADLQRRADVGLHGVDIQIKYDGLEVLPVLNISTTTMRSRFRAGEEIRFLATSNYPAFIERAEIRIEEMPASSSAATKPQTVIPVTINREARWIMPAVERSAGVVPFDERAPPAQFAYVLRVYDAQGRYDETEPLILTRSRRGADGSRVVRDAVASEAGEDRTALQNIAVRGGAITVFGRNVPLGYQVEVLGERILLDRNQTFVVQRLLPPGEHNVDVSVKGVSKSSGLQFSRLINLPDNDWFYIALADLTVGRRVGDENIEAVRPGEYDKTYAKGRLAFYLKGKIKGKYLLTAAADTSEDDLENPFRDLDGKDSRHLLRRLDPDDYYPIYGDDSSFVEDAPTKGKFYVRLERGDNHVMWGNYKTSITGTEFMRAERGLYGVNVVYRSEVSTSSGERRTEATLYAAQPDTLPQRQEFLATGGSAYFLRHQDIVEGSETVTVEIRDRVTGYVTARNRLQYGQDYRIDYIQGVIILQRPLSSVASTGDPVRNGAHGSNNVYLTVQYEFEPAASDVDGYVYGGRVQHWLNDYVRFGATGVNEDTGEADQRAVGADVLLRRSGATFLEAETAYSKGPGFGLSRSTDGGLTAESRPTSGQGNKSAMAYRLRGQIGLEDIFDDGPKGTLGGYYQNTGAGFSTLSERSSVDKRIWGAFAKVDLSDTVTVDLKYDDFRTRDYNPYVQPVTGSDPLKRNLARRRGQGAVSWQVDEYWKVAFGITYTELNNPFRATAAHYLGDYNGERLDAGVRVEYRPDDDRMFYGFGQGALSRLGNVHRNDRIGAGTELKLTEKIRIDAEVSYGTGGVGGLAALNYNPTGVDHYYVGYKLDPDRAFDLETTHDLVGSDKGALVIGMRRRMGNLASAYAESSYDMFGKRHSLTQTYGVIYTPDDVWTVDVGVEVGRVRDDTVDANGKDRADFNRYAPSLSVAYKDKEAGIAARLRGEVRIENSADGTRDQNTYLLAVGLSWQTSDNWRLITNVDAVVSDTRSYEASFQNRDYVEASLGYAYRPVANDRLNALFKYTWLYDVFGKDRPGSGTTGRGSAPAQRSHILSADVTYDLLPWLSIGGKYGFRYGEVKYRPPDVGSTGFVDEWQRSSAHLGILRADLHAVKNWDLLLEGRLLHVPEVDTIEYGAFVAVYRHVADNFKVGVGYNFGRFSDDLKDLTLDDQGVILNIVGKF